MDARANQKQEITPDEWRALKLRDRDRLWEHRLVWFLLVALVILIGYFYLHSRVDDSLRVKLIELFAARFPNHLIAIESAHLEKGRGILIEGVAIALPTPQGPRVIARVPRMVAQGDVHLVGLMRGEAPIRRIFMDSVDLSIWPMADGNISLLTLASDQPLPPSLPPIDIRRGLVRIAHETSRPNEEMICHDLNVSIRSQSNEGIILTAFLGSSHFSNLKVQLNLSNDKQRWNLNGDIDQLYYASQWTDRLPKGWRDLLVQLSGFQGLIQGSFMVAKVPEQPVSFAVRGRIQKGRLQHPKLPYPLDDLSGNIYCHNHLLQLRQATAHSGDAHFQLEADVHGLTVGVPVVAQLKATNLPLDDRLYQAIPPPLQEQWNKLRLAGTVDSELNLRFDGQRWHPEVVVHARNGSIHADIFPYPLSQVQGEFHYRDGILISDELTAVANGKVIRGLLRLARASPKWLVDLTLSSDGPVPIDESLMAALTPRGEAPNSLQNFIRSLSPSGSVHLERCRFVRSADDIDNLSKSLEISIHGGAIRYAGFRYPVFDIFGRIHVDNETIRIDRLKGRNDSARIQCDGNATTEAQSLAHLELNFDVQNLPLEEELQSALPVQVRELWGHLRPSGIVDHVQVKLERLHPQAALDLAVRLQEDGRDDAVFGRSVSIQPQVLPYLLHNVACDVSYRPGYVELHRFEASHDLSHVSGEGDFQVKSDGTWNGILSWLPTSRLLVDQSLLIALPETIRAPLTAMEFRGPLAITGQTYVTSSASDSQPRIKAWDVQIEIEDGQLAGGTLASGIRGSLHAVGEQDTAGPIVKGYLTLDALAVRGVPVTNLTGPIAVSDNKLLLGRSARQVQVRPLAVHVAVDRQLSQVIPASAVLAGPSSSGLAAAVAGDTPSPSPASHGSFPEAPRRVAVEVPKLDIQEDDLRARAFAGTLHVHGYHPLLEGQTEIRLTLNDASLSGFLADMGENHEQATGRLWVDCQMAGSLPHSNTMSGVGNVWIREANFYQMPIMARLFRVLSVKPPEDGAFESADVRFRLDGDRIPLDRISLDGDIISLRGSGWCNLRRELQLDLYAYVGNRSPMAAILGPLISQNDSATMLQLEVSGTTDRMEFRRNIPLIGANWQQIFPERVVDASNPQAGSVSP